MNERIKELIEKAEDPEHGFIIPEKFAELILADVYEILDDFRLYPGPGDEDLQWTKQMVADAANMTLSTAKLNVMQRFKDKNGQNRKN